jgi:hypothetical protein
MTPAAYDPLRALRTLQGHGVDFVVIGGFAGRLWGSPTLTNDLDICAAWDRPNLDRLAAALVDLHAHLRDAPEDVLVPLDGAFLAAGSIFTLATDAGGLDVLGSPAGGYHYSGLMVAARSIDLGDLSVDVVDLDDLIEMKRAAGRAKDRIEVEVLEAVRNESER